MIRIKISVGKVTYIPVTYKAKIDGQTFYLIFMAVNIRAKERETVTYNRKGCSQFAEFEFCKFSTNFLL